jgi:hypothetical protein
MYARTHRMQDAEHGLGHRRRGAIRDLAQPRPTALAINQGDKAGRSLADDGVAFEVTHAAALLDDGGTFVNPPPAKALALPRRTAAVTSTSLAPTQVLSTAIQFWPTSAVQS